MQRRRPHGPSPDADAGSRTSDVDDALWTAIRLQDFRSLDQEFQRYGSSSTATTRSKAHLLWRRLRAQEKRLIATFWLAVDEARRLLREAPEARDGQASLGRLASSFQELLDRRAGPGPSLDAKYEHEARRLREVLGDYLMEQMHRLVEHSSSRRSVKNASAIVIGAFWLSTAETAVRSSAYSIPRDAALGRNTQLDGSVRAFLREAVSNAAQPGERSGEQALCVLARRLLRQSHPTRRRRRQFTRASSTPKLPQYVVTKPKAFTFELMRDDRLGIFLSAEESSKVVAFSNGKSRWSTVGLNTREGNLLASVMLNRQLTPTSVSTLRRARRAIRETTANALALTGTRTAPRFSQTVFVSKHLYDRLRVESTG
ncbi:MAG: hypothetical protein JNL90_10635 [Planctomycetes bacterium]|nr:hypothetical protein [Planctomycetota bacterium]